VRVDLTGEVLPSLNTAVVPGLYQALTLKDSKLAF